MYTYVKSLTLSKGFNATWSEDDRYTEALGAIFQTTTEFFLTLKEPISDKEVYVDMKYLLQDYATSTKTVEQWLIDNGDNTLPLITKLPDHQLKYVKFSNATQAGYRVFPVKRGYDLDASLPLSDRPDLVLSRKGYETNLALIHSHCLTTVGGFLHNTDTDGNASYIIDGTKVIEKRGFTHVGLISFLDIGRLTKVKIKKENIHRLEVDTPLSDKLVFTTDADLTNKSYLLSIGGYLVTPEDKVFWRSGDQSFTVHLQSLNYIERYLESKGILDLSSLGLPPSDINENVVSLEDLMSDETIKRYLTLSQSFLIVVDTPFLSVNKIHLRGSHVPNKFTSYQDPSYPLSVGYGRLAEYWKTPEAGYWSLAIPDSFYRHFIAGQQPTQFIKMVNDHLLSCPPYYFSRGVLLEMAGTPTI